MAKDLNKVQLTGRLGANPEFRHTLQGSAVATFRVASNRAWKSSRGEDHEDTEWFRIVAWDRLAEVCQEYLRKGTRVYIEGRLQTRQWFDQAGQVRYTTEVIASDLILLDTRRDPPGVAPASEPPAGATVAPERPPAPSAVPESLPAGATVAPELPPAPSAVSEPPPAPAPAPAPAPRAASRRRRAPRAASDADTAAPPQVTLEVQELPF